MTVTHCPICNKPFKDRLRNHLIQKHNIHYQDATIIKNLCIGLEHGISKEKQGCADKIKKKLAENGFRFEKLRMEA